MRRALLSLAAVVALLPFAGPALAQSSAFRPTKTVTIIVPYSPGGGGLPNLFGDGGIFNPGNPTPATPDAGTPPAGDPNGPCSALNLICFDAIDMFIHPECLTCNNGKGCQGCFITAY